jgi:hemolysin activation/secretion protein
VVQEFIGKELDFEGLNDAATKVRAYHRSRGYFLAQAYLPQQAIRNGSVEIAVIEGRVGQVELQRRPATRLSEWLLAGILNAHPPDRRHHYRDRPREAAAADQRLADRGGHLRDPARARSSGAADLRVNVDQGVGLLNGFVDFDNQGSRFTGEYRRRASA